MCVRNYCSEWDENVQKLSYEENVDILTIRIILDIIIIDDIYDSLKELEDFVYIIFIMLVTFLMINMNFILRRTRFC